ncbi:uncharacterized protein [Nicotiana sylvestris]|uniref:uncharacterized protein n=1 Tax=Nicotiana sylvestris TaxID=4096 RepID=UPI00388CA4B4
MGKSPDSWIKINTDESKNVKGYSSSGRICRDHSGNMIVAFVSSLGMTSSNMTEARAVLFGLHWYVLSGYSQLILECDSLLVVKMLKGVNKVPWQMHGVMSLEKPKALSTRLILIAEFNIALGGANQVANTLAKWSIDKTDAVFTSSSDLPHGAKGPYRLDMAG